MIPEGNSRKFTIPRDIYSSATNSRSSKYQHTWNKHERAVDKSIVLLATSPCFSFRNAQMRALSSSYYPTEHIIGVAHLWTDGDWSLYSHILTNLQNQIIAIKGIVLLSESIVHPITFGSQQELQNNLQRGGGGNYCPAGKQATCNWYLQTSNCNWYLFTTTSNLTVKNKASIIIDHYKPVMYYQPN